MGIFASTSASGLGCDRMTFSFSTLLVGTCRAGKRLPCYRVTLVPLRSGFQALHLAPKTADRAAARIPGVTHFLQQAQALRDEDARRKPWPLAWRRSFGPLRSAGRYDRGSWPNLLLVTRTLLVACSNSWNHYGHIVCGSPNRLVDLSNRCHLGLSNRTSWPVWWTGQGVPHAVRTTIAIWVCIEIGRPPVRPFEHGPVYP